MFAAERYAKIREILSEFGHADLATLCSILSVSEATVRRDLEKLEREGFLSRTHGGAVLIQEGSTVTPDQNDSMLEEKRLISGIAVQMIENGESIFLSAGSTTLQIAKKLKNHSNLTVVTNSFQIMQEIVQYRGITAISTGGNAELQGNQLALSGKFAVKMLSDIFFDKSFISVNGISIEHGYTVQNAELAEVYSKAIENSMEAIVAADYKKFGRRSFTKLGDIKLFQKVVTNMQVGLEYKKFYFDNEIQCYTTFDDVGA